MYGIVLKVYEQSITGHLNHLVSWLMSWKHENSWDLWESNLHGSKWMEDLWRKPWNILNIEISVDSMETCKIISVFHGLKVIDMLEHPHAWGSLLLLLLLFLLLLLPNDCVLVDRYDKHYDKHFNSFTSWNMTIFFLEGSFSSHVRSPANSRKQKPWVGKSTYNKIWCFHLQLTLWEMNRWLA